MVECQPALVRSLRCVAGIDALVQYGQRLVDFDVHAPLPSLPHLLKCTLEILPRQVPYIFFEPDLQSRCRQMVSALPGVRVGINWQGNPKFVTDRFRSIPLTCFAPLAQLANVTLVSLQHGAGTEQLDEIQDDLPIFDLGRQLDALAPSADHDVAAYRMALSVAAIACLDLVITSDTMMAHLAGAMGRPVWLLVSSSPD